MMIVVCTVNEGSDGCVDLLLISKAMLVWIDLLALEVSIESSSGKMEDSRLLFSAAFRYYCSIGGKRVTPSWLLYGMHVTCSVSVACLSCVRLLADDEEKSDTIQICLARTTVLLYLSTCCTDFLLSYQ